MEIGQAARKVDCLLFHCCNHGQNRLSVESNNSRNEGEVWPDTRKTKTVPFCVAVEDGLKGGESAYSPLVIQGANQTPEMSTLFR